MDKVIWGIHSNYPDFFVQNNYIGIGWEEFGDLSKIPNDVFVFRKKYKNIYNENDRAVSLKSGMLYKFIYEMKIGDYVVFPYKPTRDIYIGEIIGDYEYEKNSKYYDSKRKIKWLKIIPRDKFSKPALYESNAIMTLFKIKNNANEFINALNDNFSNINDDENLLPSAKQIEETTKDFIINELQNELKGYDFEYFVEDLFVAMGYKTKVSTQGGDSGVDIIAYKDELPPRIVVQVKSLNEDIKESSVQQLKGAMGDGDYGVFVTLSNFKPNAIKFLENNPKIKGINGADLVDLILKYYEQLSEKYKKIIPLKKVYLPIINIED